MAQIKTVTTTSGENTITFDSFYPYVWIRNSGDNDITAANYSGAQAGDENTVSIKAGEVAMIQAETENIYIIGATTCEIHAQGFAERPFKRGLGGGEQISVESLSVTTNGTYTAPSGTAYSPVTVDVQEQPWSPLQDGYSNFWLELTDDTLSPWLNFSAKNADAVIDWGDGSGEVALDTLTPTHTYSKAGKYVVKCKGVTGLAQQHTEPYQGEYLCILKAIETNNEITDIANSALTREVGLKNIYIPDVNAIYTYAFYLNTALTNIVMPKISGIGAQPFYQCVSLEKITIPNTCTAMGNYCFYECRALKEIHIQAITPPIAGTNIFQGLASNFIIYVPTGTAETYKSAAGWSAYADHILEEGQTVTRAMQRKFAKEKALEEDTEDMR